jgi:hypothetical protein
VLYEPHSFDVSVRMLMLYIDHKMCKNKINSCIRNSLLIPVESAEPCNLQSFLCSGMGLIKLLLQE